MVKEIEMSEDEYEDYLNECYGTVLVCGMEMDSGTVLKECDPIAFRCGLSEEPIKYECEECGEVYEDEEEAEECEENCTSEQESV